MSSKIPPQQTGARVGLAVGPTKGLAGGLSKRTGGTHGFGAGTTKQRGTRGGTTSNTKTEAEIEYTIFNGEKIWIKPKPLMKSHQPKVEGQPGSTSTGQQAATTSKDAPAGSQPKESGAPQTKEQTTTSMHSQLTSSLMETSEDEEAKKKEQEKQDKKSKKGLNEKELEAFIDIELCETQTFELLFIPSSSVANDGDEFTHIAAENKKYDELKANKVGSDSYTQRGSQTLNLALKSKEIMKPKFDQESKDLQASKWDIDDALNQQRLSEAKKQQIQYGQMVEDIISEKLKNPNCLIDAEALASHISIVTTQSGAPAGKTGANKSGSTSSNSQKAKVNSSSQLQASTNKSQTSMSGTSMSQTQTNAISSETALGDFNAIPKNVEYVEADLPDTMMKAIRIIERLLTQSKYHEQHVLYKNYPPVNLGDKNKKSQQEEDEENQGKKPFGLAIKKDSKKEREEEKKEEDKDNKELDSKEEVSLKPLFKFQFDFTEGRQVSCIDINIANPDLIAVGYGEYDIDCTKTLKEGMLCFWTLKNPNFPEKIIKTEHSITCCQFSKKNPHLIAVGDSHGNIAIYNVRTMDQKPIAESKDLEGKHTDIVWEIQWVDRDTKGESLVSVSGDGRVIEWSMKKGLEFTELMQLKRETNPNQKDVFGGVEGDKKGNMTFINTGGLSIDFPATESGMIYFAATEDCAIHRCSVSYSEQYYETYYGHTGPIYKVRCNPFWHQIECPIFMTCSYDWTVRIWKTKEINEKLVCHEMSNKEQVNDVQWSPHTSSVFASVTNDGRIEIWDLKKDNLAPLIIHFDTLPDGTKQNIPKTVVAFSRDSPVILSGNAKGQVDVYRVNGLEHVQVSEKDQINRLLQAIQKDDFTETKGKKKEDEGEEEAA